VDYDEEYDDALEYEDSDYSSAESEDMTAKDEAGDGFDPMDITNPASAYFFLSDDGHRTVMMRLLNFELHDLEGPWHLLASEQLGGADYQRSPLET